MTRSSPRPLLPWLACALLTAACDYHPVPKPEGECTGTYKGQNATWPIITVTSVQSAFSHSDGSTNTQLNLNYTTEGIHGLQGFGASPMCRTASMRNPKMTTTMAAVVPRTTTATTIER